jgi:hypothetical protein
LGQDATILLPKTPINESDTELLQPPIITELDIFAVPEIEFKHPLRIEENDGPKDVLPEIVF